MTTHSIQSLIAQGEKILGEASVESPRRTAEYLVAHTLQCERLSLFLKYETHVNDHSEKMFFDSIARRKAREPLAYIVGSAGFLGLDFEVNAHVLIPRPETEKLVEITLDELKEHNNPSLKIADLGTGSGNICVSLAVFLNPYRRNLSMKEQLGEARKNPDFELRIFATDISSDALLVAKRNAGLHQVDHLIQFLPGSLLAPLWPLGLKEQLDCIISNPPYIDSSTLCQLEPEVRDHEPACALDGGNKGLALYPRIIEEAYQGLVSGGLLALEIGDYMHEDIKSLFGETARWAHIRFFQDAHGVTRFVLARKEP